MQPIGLTLKDIKFNPFTGKTNAELMIVHLCIHCGRISCNRIAGDDNTYSIMQLLETKENSYPDIPLLSKNDMQKVKIILFGDVD